MKCNICQNETFDEIKQKVDSLKSDGWGNPDGTELLKIIRKKKVGSQILNFEERINIYACQKCGNLQIEVK